MIAYCRASGLVEFADACPPGCVWVAESSDEDLLKRFIRDNARRAARYAIEKAGRGHRRVELPDPHLIAPGVPEGRDVSARVVALTRWCWWLQSRAPKEVKVSS